jgi:hypothetical protein
MPALRPDEIAAALNQSSAFRGLPRHQQAEMLDAMGRVFDYLGDGHLGDAAPARPFAPDLGALRGGTGGTGGSTGGSTGGGTATGAASGTASPPGTAPATPSQNAFQRAAGATKEMLGAIGFPDFVASLIKGTFQAIVDSSIQQMEAYSRLLAETAKTVDQFMADNISDDMARDHLTSTYGEVFQKDLSAGYPQMTVNPSVPAGQLPSFLKDLGFDSPADLDQTAIDNVVIPETRMTLAEMRHQSLATMVMMGINRIVVSDGEINAKLIFHIDATESMALTFNDYKPTNWTLAGQLGSNAFGASGIVVNTTSLNTQSDVNMNTDLTGEVRVRFRSDYFPLERFADSAAIQLINSHAKVAQPLPAPAAAAPSTGAPAPAGAVPPPLPPAGTPPPGTAAQGLRRR